MYTSFCSVHGAYDFPMFLAIISSLTLLAIVSSLLQCKKPSLKAMRRQSVEDLVAPEIALDLMIEILTRLPAKSLMRFKCVSKSWSCLIRSRYFTNLHLIMVGPPTRSPHLYVSFMEHLDCDSMEFCHNPGNSVLVSLSSSSTKASNGNPFWERLRLPRHWIPNSVECFDQDMRMPGLGGHGMVVLRGLILYMVCKKACIYNPTTRQSLTLPAVKSNIFGQEEPLKCVDYFLGHDPVLDQYKVVCIVAILSEDYEIITSEHWVFVLEVGGSWKRIEFNQPHEPTNVGLCIDGVIYYLANTSMCWDTVVSFDVRSEEFSMIQPPDDVSELAESVGLIDYGGEVTIFDYSDLIEEGLVNLWVLEDGGKWSRKSLVLKPCQMHLVDKQIDLKVEGTTRNGEVILAPCNRKLISPCYILYYDLKNNDMRRVKIRGLHYPWWFIKPYFDFKLMDKSESIIHLET